MKTRWFLFLVLAGCLAVASAAQGQEGAGPPQVEPPRPRDSGAPIAAGDGLKIGRRQILDMFMGLAGIPMWALVFCVFLTTSFTVERLVALQSRRIAPRAFTTRFLQQLRERELDAGLAGELAAVCRNHDSPIARFFSIVIENRGCSAFEIRTAVADVADSELFPLRKRIRAIGGLAALAPLLGLFGTVIGMIDAFQALSRQSGAGKTELLAAGISLALIATASGLGVAIMASVSYYFLQGRVDQRIQDLEVLTNQAVALVTNPSRPRPVEAKPRRVPVEEKVK